jgi:hypothetical protein
MTVGIDPVSWTRSQSVRSSGRLWCKRRGRIGYSGGWTGWGPAMGKLKSVEEMFEGRHFSAEVIILCVRWYL